ncbi:MAG: TetR/AcrR family transcriptional regulator [Acidimicrobiia bacterium]|nr:TetR/AcrR family transcriptional regulator [Acidimicrobiia bacterium]MDQ3391001.1 TetR/AcrR family transcriptional regulator [Actinomycetota bacterium]
MAGSARRHMLDAGIDLLHETGVVTGVTHIKLARVAKRAGYTTGAAYRFWPTQEDFHRDLAIAALEWRDRSSIADTIASIRPVVDGGAPLLEVLRTGAEANVHRFPAETDFFITLALRASAVHASGELVEASRTRVEEGLQSHVELYEALMAMFGRRPRPPYTSYHLASVLAALAEGFAIQDVGGEHQHLDRPDLGKGIGSDWTLFGSATQAVVEHFTEPIDAARK